MRSYLWKTLRYSLLVLWIATILWQTHKPLPEGVNQNGASIAMPQEDIQFLSDVTAYDAWGRRVVEQQIFDAIFSAIDNAQHFIVIDFFLFNDDMGATTDAGYRPLSRELTDHLLARKQAHPEVQILFITDPINDVYGGRPSPLLADLKRAGIEVVRTDLEALRDSNPLYSSAWRIAVQWFGNSAGGGWLPDPFREQDKVTLRSWLSLANFKANHRKVIVVDAPNGEVVGIVTSANPHDASSLHSNVAWRFSGELALQVLKSEMSVARFSGWHGQLQSPTTASRQGKTMLEAAYITEGAIRLRLLDAILATKANDFIDVAEFYLSDRDIIDALKDAAARGVKIQLILDPNKDAFGKQKDGVPNRPVANELLAAGNKSTDVRWYRTQGEQFHTKLVLVKHDQQLLASLGSANLTRRNIGNYNLEANVNVSMPIDSPLARQVVGYFERLWNNDGQRHIEFTVPFGAYQDDSALSYWRYRVMEMSGVSTF